jgi:hypothetical protein
METTNTKVWTEAAIVSLLTSNNRAVEKAILAIFARQTEDEKQSESTHHDNSRGFSAADARTGSYMARWILSGKRLDGKFLDKGRKIAVKYRKQLLEVANG